MDNIYSPVNAAVVLLKTLVLPELVFIDTTLAECTAQSFSGLPDADAVAVTIVYTGYKVAATAGSCHNKTSLIEAHYRVMIVGPAELHDSVLGSKCVEVMRALNGFKPDDSGYKPMQLVDDSEFGNSPAFDPDLVGIPMMFSLKVAV